MIEKPKKLLDQVRDKLRLKNYSYATEKTYIGWIRPGLPHAAVLRRRRHVVEQARRGKS